MYIFDPATVYVGYYLPKACRILLPQQVLNPDRCSGSFPGLYYLPEFAQTCVHWVSYTIQPSHPLLPPFPLALNLSQYQNLFQWVWIIFHFWIFFIHSCVDGHLGCFCNLPVVNNVAMNFGVYVSFQITVFIFFGYTSKGMELLDQGVVFWEISILFSIVAAPVYIPTSRIPVFPILHSLGRFVICGLFDDHSVWSDSSL